MQKNKNMVLSMKVSDLESSDPPSYKPSSIEDYEGDELITAYVRFISKVKLLAFI